jgi:hypothetical protein
VMDAAAAALVLHAAEKGHGVQVEL